MPTLPALEDFADFSFLVAMDVEQTYLRCQFETHLENSLDPLILLIIKALHSEVLPKRFAIHSCPPSLLHLSCNCESCKIGQDHKSHKMYQIP